jgi:hypothetical protein
MDRACTADNHTRARCIAASITNPKAFGFDSWCLKSHSPDCLHRSRERCLTLQKCKIKKLDLFFVTLTNCGAGNV